MRHALTLRFAAIRCCLLLLSFGQGCIPHWQVVKQATPDPFVGQKKFVIEQPSFDGLMVGSKSEAEFKSKRSDEDNARWDADKRRVVDAFGAALRDAGRKYEWANEASAEAVMVRSHVTNMHGGISLGVGSTPAHVTMTVQLLKGHDLLDEFITAAEYSQGESIHVVGIATGGYSVGHSGSDRLGKCGDRLGKYVADYLDSRTKP